MNAQDELQILWSGLTTRSTTKGEELVRLVQKNLRRFDRIILVRNLVECTAAAFVAVFFSLTSRHAHNALERTGELLIAAGAVWITFFLLRYGRSGPTADPTLDLTSYGRVLTERYDRQIWLLKSVKYWYLLPLYVGLLITSAGGIVESSGLSGRSLHGPIEIIPALLLAFTKLRGWDLLVPLAATLFFVFLWWLNEVRAVRHLLGERARLALLLSGSEFTEYPDAM